MRKMTNEEVMEELRTFRDSFQSIANNLKQIGVLVDVQYDEIDSHSDQALTLNTIVEGRLYDTQMEAFSMYKRIDSLIEDIDTYNEDFVTDKIIDAVESKIREDLGLKKEANDDPDVEDD